MGENTPSASATSSGMSEPTQLSERDLAINNYVLECAPGSVNWLGPDDDFVSIIEPNLLLSGQEVTLEDCKGVLVGLGVTHIVNMTRNSPCSHEDSFEYLHLKLDDSRRERIHLYFPQIVQFISEAHQEGGRVLVHCRKGVSRSPAAVIAYIMHKNGESLENAWNHVSSCRPCVMPNPSFMVELRMWETDLFGETTHSQLHQYDTKPFVKLDWKHSLKEKLHCGAWNQSITISIENGVAWLENPYSNVQRDTGEVKLIWRKLEEFRKKKTETQHFELWLEIFTIVLRFIFVTPRWGLERARYVIRAIIRDGMLKPKIFTVGALQTKLQKFFDCSLWTSFTTNGITQVELWKWKTTLLKEVQKMKEASGYLAEIRAKLMLSSHTQQVKAPSQETTQEPSWESVVEEVPESYLLTSAEIDQFNKCRDKIECKRLSEHIFWARDDGDEGN